MRGKINDCIFWAYVLLLSNRIDEAESNLLQGKFFYRAIKININLFRWDRALSLAISNKVHVDTVLYYRKKYLEGANLEETNAKFNELSKDVILLTYYLLILTYYLLINFSLLLILIKLKKELHKIKSLKIKLIK